MRLVPGNTFTMGCLDGRDADCEDDEKPARRVTLSDFYLDETEVTNEQYAAFLLDYGSDKAKAGPYAGEQMIYEYGKGMRLDAKSGRWAPAAGHEYHPVARVTWYGAHEYARFYGLRLPTEAEWEYVARGGAASKGFRTAVRTIFTRWGGPDATRTRPRTRFGSSTPMNSGCTI